MSRHTIEEVVYFENEEGAICSSPYSAIKNIGLENDIIIATSKVKVMAGGSSLSYFFGKRQAKDYWECEHQEILGGEG